MNEARCEPRTHTKTLEPSLETRQTNEHQPDVHKAKIGDDGEEVQDQLLGYVEVFQVGAVVACKHESLQLGWDSGGSTCEFKPDSVLPLTARKKASMAVRLPKA